MTIELLSGEAAVNSATESEFAGFRSPRRFQISEALSNRASSMLSSAFRNEWGASVRLAEAFSTSDFTLGAAQELDKELLAQYEELPTVWDRYVDQTTVRDFRPKRLVSRWSTTVGLPRVPELTEYPASDRRAHSEYAISVAKHGARKAISWEAWINNEAIDELQDMPTELAREARETEMINAASTLLLVDPLTNTASDVNTDFFKAANGNAPTSLPLTRDNLKAVLDGMAVKPDPNSTRTIARPPVVVVIPKALETQMESIMRPFEIRRTDVDGNITLETNEFSNVTYVADPMLDYLNTHANAATTWFVVPQPRSRRPALWVARLAGYEAPDLRVKSNQGKALSGGDISPREGSFEVDDVQWRCRHIVGNQVGDPLFTYCSRGA